MQGVAWRRKIWSAQKKDGHLLVLRRPVTHLAPRDGSKTTSTLFLPGDDTSTFGDEEKSHLDSSCHIGEAQTKSNLSLKHTDPKVLCKADPLPAAGRTSWGISEKSKQALQCILIEIRVGPKRVRGSSQSGARQLPRRRRGPRLGGK